MNELQKILSARRLCCLLLIASTISCFAQEARVAGLDIESRMAHYQVPGVSIAVIRNNSIEWAKGYGYRDVERQLPVDTHTMFEAHSINKPAAAMGALWLVEQGKWNLDEMLTKSSNPGRCLCRPCPKFWMESKRKNTVWGFKGRGSRKQLQPRRWRRRI